MFATTSFKFASITDTYESTNAQLGLALNHSDQNIVLTLLLLLSIYKVQVYFRIIAFITL